MKVLCTGSSGYIGSKLITALKEKGHEVEVFDKPKDIRNEEEFRQAVKGKDIVYHLAALAELKYTDAHPQETYDVNILGANVIAKVCAEEGVLLNFVSTCCIYGNAVEKVSREGRMINPSDTYAMSKAAGEYVVKMWGLAKGLKYNILRFGTVYGQSLKKEMRMDMAIQKFVDAAVNHLPMTVTGDGSQARNFIHIDDLVGALVLLAGSKAIGETINLGGKERTTILEIAKQAQELGAGEITFIPERKDDFFDQNVSLAKAKKLLGWSPKVKFKEGLKAMYEWQKNL